MCDLCVNCGCKSNEEERREFLFKNIDTFDEKHGSKNDFSTEELEMMFEEQESEVGQKTKNNNEEELSF